MEKKKWYLFALVILTSVSIGLDILKLQRAAAELDELKKSK